MPFTRKMAKKEIKCFSENIKKSIKNSKNKLNNSTNSKKTHSIDYLLSLCRPVSVRLERSVLVKNMQENKTNNGNKGNF